PIASSYNSACNQAGALGPIADRPFNPLKVKDVGAGEDIAGGGTALRKPGNLFLGFLKGDNVGKVATGRLSMILDIVRSVTRTLATCLEWFDSRVFNGTLSRLAGSDEPLVNLVN
ncbi:hypothetical protein THAOC_19982, partial [Thalassiosira oceanica]